VSGTTDRRASVGANRYGPPVELTALILAVLGLVLSVTSLAWQATTFRLSGPRVRVELIVGAVSLTSIGTVPVNDRDWQDQLRMLQRNHLPDALIGIRVRNVGRQATTVTHFAASFDTGAALGYTGVARGCPTLPHRMEPESADVWWMPLLDVARFVQLSAALEQPISRVHCKIELGTGRALVTDRCLHREDLEAWAAATA
jgi:hypothetical protein